MSNIECRERVMAGKERGDRARLECVSLFFSIPLTDCGGVESCVIVSRFLYDPGAGSDYVDDELITVSQYPE